MRETRITASNNLEPNIEYHKFVNMPRDKRVKRDLHALNKDGMVMCNPRDKEAALRVQTEGIATND
jgi:glutamate mutase epsilon subunit